MMLIFLVSPTRSARADVDMVAPPAPTGAITPYAVSAPGGYNCSAAGGWVTVANYPSGFAIGNCASGWSMERQICGSSSCDWSGGYVYGNYSGCGWIATTSLISNGGYPGDSACSSSSSVNRDVDTFATYANCQPGTCTDGSATTLAANCTEYGNYRPWSSSPGFVNPIRTFSAARTVLWRYITKSGSAVMVHDAGVGGAGYGNWVFVAKSCINSFPGQYYVGDWASPV